MLLSVYSSSSILLGDYYVDHTLSTCWVFSRVFFLGTQIWELRTLSGDSFPSDERRWILYPRGFLCVLGRCAEAPPCSPVSLLSSRFRSRAPLEVLGIQMDQRYTHMEWSDRQTDTHTHTHTWMMLTLSRRFMAPESQTLHRMNYV